MNLLELPRDMIILICYDNIVTYNKFSRVNNYCYNISKIRNPRTVFLEIVVDENKEFSVLKETRELYGTSYQWYPCQGDKNGKTLERMYNMKRGVLDGLFRIWYQNGMIERECIFRGNKIVGTIKYWYNTNEKSIIDETISELDKTYPPNTCGQLRQISNYIYNTSYDQSDMRHGLCQKYHIDGRLKCIANYIDGKKEGLVYKWNTKGQQSQIPYVDGKKHGIAKMWSENGTIIFIEQEYKNGLKDGIYRSQYHNTKEWITITGLYKNNMLHGEYIEKYFDGKIYSKCTYINGELEGERITYHKNGMVWEVKYYVNGRGMGTVQTWNEEGHVIS
ncbi:MORN-repeat protein [Orpheovirus IHUMI-LCC2]|uniref:MORN-repeat protein n=1 Tax=Orpheovirus IHUMI-LCC2 TaxID=2023057 RepID=A0A2I2L3K0_9VIRU|nr:MORN-repeat protein [Orpheovirus IHUMI-LCC2]SNW62114.1 MORN-repeat protein [Orpheovirus IHUMI-LCC2]